MDCGESDPIVLDFDHSKGRRKRAAIADLVRGGALRWGTILREIEKCEVRCANCHRRRTATELGWYRGRKPAVGVEPTTTGLRNRCSTTELRRRDSGASTHRVSQEVSAVPRRRLQADS